VCVLDGISPVVVREAHAFVVSVYGIRLVFVPEFPSCLRTYVVEPKEHYDEPSFPARFQRLLYDCLRYRERRIRDYHVVYGELLRAQEVFVKPCRRIRTQVVSSDVRSSFRRKAKRIGHIVFPVSSGARIENHVIRTLQVHGIFVLLELSQEFGYRFLGSYIVVRTME